MVSRSEAVAGTLPFMAVDPETLLLPLNDAQRAAARAVTGPVVIHAGAGTGKTTVLTRRAAYAIATGAVRPERMLLVTFTEKAAGELVSRIGALGLPRVAARTFHSAALAQLRHFWPQHHDGQPLPEILDSPSGSWARSARRLPGGYKFTPAKDLVDEIGWARSRGIGPETYAADHADREPPLPMELFLGVFRDYERQKRRAGVIDFDDMLLLTADILDADPAARDAVRGKYAWFCVDEYQDTSPVQQRLLELWTGDRRDVCVVGDEDQTIYTFSGASSRFLTGFADRYPGATVVHLTENHRSTPEILSLANRLIAASGRAKGLVATRPGGPPPTVTAHGSEVAELAGIVAAMRRLHGTGTNGQAPHACRPGRCAAVGRGQNSRSSSCTVQGVFESGCLTATGSGAVNCANVGEVVRECRASAESTWASITRRVDGGLNFLITRVHVGRSADRAFYGLPNCGHRIPPLPFST